MEAKRAKLVSLVVPCHNEEASLPLLAEEVNRVCSEVDENKPKAYRFEVILVDDGSTDGTLARMRELPGETFTPPLKFSYLSFSRNFGKEAALYAGLKSAKGDLVATMDADMQDPPSLLPEMLDILESDDWDNVATRRTTRKGEPPIRSFFSRMFYRLINLIGDAEIVDGARDFRLMKRPMVDAVLSLSEHNRFSKGIYGWVGFRTKWIEFENVERVAGNSSWNFLQLFAYSIEGIVSFSVKPLDIASMAGMTLFVISLIFGAGIIGGKLVFGNPVAGWSSLACITLFVGGIQLFCTGILGKYLAKDYIENKNRPLYLVRETNIDKDEAVNE